MYIETLSGLGLSYMYSFYVSQKSIVLVISLYTSTYKIN